MFFSLPIPPPSLEFTVERGKGLLVLARGVPVVRGSSVQFYKPGWSKGYYSSTYGPQTITQLDSNSVKVEYTSVDRLAHGIVTYSRQADKLTAHYEFQWHGDEAANLEVTDGLIWAPAFERGNLSADGMPTRNLRAFSYSGNGLDSRRFSGDASRYLLTAPVGVLDETSSIPLTLFDARGYGQDFATGHEYWWLGSTAIPISKEKPVAFDVVFQVDLVAKPPSNFLKLTMNSVSDLVALAPDTQIPPLIPKPESAKLDWKHPLIYSGGFSYPVGQFDHLDDFKAALGRRFDLSAVGPAGKGIPFDGGVSKLGMVPGGYRLTITPSSISVLGDEDEGLRNGLNRLAAIAFLSGGKVCFPTGTIVDQPRTDWRGVHLFVGPKALNFQTRLWDRVLCPLGFNKVVLQCERTSWDSFPQLTTPNSMAKADLIRLFGFYRRIGVDPIPLIQSYGHMDWFFENKQNLDIASGPGTPYSVDPNNPKTAERLSLLWQEAVEALHPTVVHFGLDEVDMLGPKIEPPALTTLWGTQLGNLEAIAKKNKVGMMLWGDEALAPGEAPDATNGGTSKDAAERRDAIPRGSFIGDWHYTGSASSSDFRTNLQIWKDAGMKPIASTWFNPKNIAAYDVEAGLLGCGSLQTTWCGYYSSEEGMLQAFNQFSAMVLAADYSWSGRHEDLDELDYDPASIFRKMYFGKPSALVARPGMGLTLANPVGDPFTVGNVSYSHPISIGLATNLVGSEGGAAEANLETNVKGTRLEVACNTPIRAEADGIPVAELFVQLADGRTVSRKFVYGLDVRSLNDRVSLPLADRNPAGICSVEINLGNLPVQIKGITVRELNPYTGFTVKGLEVLR